MFMRQGTKQNKTKIQVKTVTDKEKLILKR